MTWKNPETWEKMLRGEDCAMCADFPLKKNKHSFLIAEGKQSYIRLPRNQYWRGWVLVGLKRHATELFQLSDKELAEFWQDVSTAAKAVQNVFSPVKINYAIFGNLNPHLHCHIFPQYLENDPHAPIKQDAEEVFLDQAEYEEMIVKLRKALEE